MGNKVYAMMDGNEAVAQVAYRINEVIAIYPITPSSAMGEWADQWGSEGIKNIWNSVPQVVEMQSEAGAAGAVHGALQGGALATTFTSSQGLLLMIPNMYKIAGELTSAVFHVAARAIATQGLSIFGDQSDVMATRATGFAMLASNSVQEAMDFALIAQAASLEARVPFLHFFDGFRTSHEVSKFESLTDDDLRFMIEDEMVRAHRARRLSPDRPVLRGTAQDPDVYFQGRESVNSYYNECSDTLEKVFKKFASRTGRSYRLFDYHGAPDADRVLIIMGSGAEAAHETVDYLNAQGEKLGVLKVRLYRPFDTKRFVESLPPSTKAIAVLDRTKEPGSIGEPLYLDCVAALEEELGKGHGKLRTLPKIIGGRYGLGSKEFNPAMIKSIFDELKKKDAKNHFTIGIEDDVTGSSLSCDKEFSIEPADVKRMLFYGLGSDGTVGANKNSIRIIGANTNKYVQGYFVYDSKKAGAVTVSHLRFGPRPIRSTYLITKANFLACHQHTFVERYDMLEHIAAGGIFLLNTHFGPDEVWKHIPREVAEQIVEKKLSFYVIDAHKVAKESGMGGRINTVMQVCFFAISGVLPREQAMDEIRKSIEKTYGKKGPEIVSMNLQAVEHSLEHLFQVKIPERLPESTEKEAAVPDRAPKFVREVLGEMIAGRGDELPVSALPCDGTYPTGTTQWEKRNLAQEIPVWDPHVCIECGKCAMVCPHAVIRIKVYDPKFLENAPPTFKNRETKDPLWKGLRYTIQVAPEDCTGCGICVDICPAKNKAETRLKAINMSAQEPLQVPERENWNFFLNLPEADRRTINNKVIKYQQLQQPLFEFSGACAGCGETPYIKLMTQLFGDRVTVANATGCSSIYGGNLPTTPWAKNADGRGPAWSNSLFEDNAEFGLGMRLAIDQQRRSAAELLEKLHGEIGKDLADSILSARQIGESDIFDQRDRVEALKQKLKQTHSPDARRLLEVADYLVKKSVWILGGDGWAYDIGFGGLDHVFASGRNVNILVLDTEVYSNTGGQMSKATPRGAVAKFAAAGKPSRKKDLGLMAMTYGNVYVAQVAMGARDEHTLKAFLEAEAYEGPSLIIAYSHCIAHGINMTTAMQNQKAAVEAGQWLLYRYHPERRAQGENPLVLDSKAPKKKVEEFLMMENRFKMLTKTKPDEVKQLFKRAQQDADERYRLYEYMAAEKSNKAGEVKKSVHPPA